MHTQFTLHQLAEPKIAEADQILKTCQHYGFCTSGCPTYTLLHDEKDGPRGRIDLIKEMLEDGGTPKADTVAHIDKCLSCMSCMTTCAVKVDYMHLVDTARDYIEENFRRPLPERLLRSSLAYVFTRPRLFRHAMTLGRIAKPLAKLAPARLQPILRLVPDKPRKTSHAVPSNAERFAAIGERKWKVALLAGCVQPELAPNINAATIDLLTRNGCEVWMPAQIGCCGSLPLHMGKSESARQLAGNNVRHWGALLQSEGLDAIIVNASGCGTTVKDYAHLLKDDPELAGLAKQVSAKAKDIAEWLAEMALPEPTTPRRYRLAYHDACSLRNAQKITNQPRALLKRAGFEVVDVPEAHFCCGSAGTYNMFQPEIAMQLGERKSSHIASTSPQMVAAGNIGCITQIGLHSATPIVHTVELLAWAYGGPLPVALEGIELQELAAPAPQEVEKTQQAPSASMPGSAPASDDLGVW